MNIEDLTGPVDWVDHGVFGYLPCPGKHLHTTNDGPKDCRIYVDGFPTIHCVHESCAELRAEATHNLRQAMKAQGWEAPPVTKEMKERNRYRDHLERVVEHLSKAKEFIYENFAWPVSEIEVSSEEGPWKPDVQTAQFIWSLFTPDETIWLGEPTETGPAYWSHFQPSNVWAHRDTVPQFICPNPLVPGSNSRTAKCLSDKRYFVIECDHAHEDPGINRDRCGAVFRYAMDQKKNLKLRAIVDSGNKSLHGWFEYPGDDDYEWCRKVLPVLGADPATMRLAQPVRTPGALRDNGRIQSLIWLGGEE